MIRQLRAAARAHFGVNAGLFPLALITAGWVAATIYYPSAYVGASIWYVASVAACMGIGLRIHLSSYRAYLVPGFREVHGIFALGLVLLPVLVASLAGPSGLSTPLFAGGLWLCVLALLYWIGLSRASMTRLWFLVFLGLLPLLKVVRGYLAEGSSHFSSRAVVFLLIANTALTILLWRRICSVRGEPWRDPDAKGLPSLFELRSKLFGESKSLDSIPGRMPKGWLPRFRYFRYSTLVGSRNFFWLVFAYSVFAMAVLYGTTGTGFATVAFGFYMVLPTAAVFGLLVRVPEGMFMLPLSRHDIVKCGGGALLLSVLRHWCALALAVSLVVLVAGRVGALSTSLLPLLVATLAAQLPLFGLATALLSLRTRAGISVVMPLLAVFLPFAAAPLVGDFVDIQQVILWSVVLGPILIWLSYRRWCNLELG